jgi:FkbM family methyltransferase
MTKAEVRFYKTIIPELDIIVDVGIKKDNIFYEINPNAEIHMFEPNTEFFNYLVDYYKDKKHKVHLNNYALSSKQGTSIFYYQYGSMQQRIDDKLKNIQKSYTISCDTLESYCVQNKITYIDYLKIDTEGHDFEVIKGAGSIINNTRFIQFEDFITFHEGEKLEDVFNYFKGWNIYKIGGKPVNYLITKEKVNLEKVR